MSHTVVWTAHAEAQLTHIWNNALDRRRITQAAREIDVQLRSDPLNVGESREPGIRIFFVTPLAITFHVSPKDRLVYVVNVWRVRR